VEYYCGVVVVVVVVIIIGGQYKGYWRPSSKRNLLTYYTVLYHINLLRVKAGPSPPQTALTSDEQTPLHGRQRTYKGTL
jgi:hypothetical protein